MQHRLDHDHRTVTTLFIGKWTVKVIYALSERPHRHGQLRRRLGNISQRMLTRTLRNLEAAGLISRQITHSRSIAVEYSLTEVGTTFVAPLGSICHWADQHGHDLNATILLSKRMTGGTRVRRDEEIKPSIGSSNN